MRGFLKDYSKDINLFFRVLDPIIITFFYWYLNLIDLNIDNVKDQYISRIIIVFLICLLILPKGKLYQNYREISLIKLTKRIFSNWLFIVFFNFIFLNFFTSNLIFQKDDFIAWIISGWIHLFFIHIVGRKLLRIYRVYGGNSISVIYWGSKEDLNSLNLQIKNNPYLGYRLTGWFDPFDKSQSMEDDLKSNGNSLSSLKNWVKENPTDLIIFSDYKNNKYEFKELITHLGDLGIPISYLPSWFIVSMSLSMTTIGNKAILNLWQPRISRLDSYLKRIFDIIISLLGLILLSPVFLITSIAIKLNSPGSIIFKQTRYGLDGKKFGIYKFRTMFVMDAGDKAGLEQAKNDDPRVTVVGRFLRKWSIDELPQLLNVLIGEMSMVGPRPHAVDHNEYYRLLIPGYMQRHMVKPGITGLAQIKGFRGQTKRIEDMQKRVEEDLTYLKEWNLLLDIKIIIKTILNLKSSKAF